jgi:hypothetical protein
MLERTHTPSSFGGDDSLFAVWISPRTCDDKPGQFVDGRQTLRYRIMQGLPVIHEPIIHLQ